MDEIGLENNKTELIFEFIWDKNKECLINSIIIKKIVIEIDLNKSNKYEFTLIDNVEEEYKTYDCLFNFKDNESKSLCITVYFNQTNYYLCGIKKDGNSAEIILSDFLSDKINIKNCFIIYDNIKYYPSEDFKLNTRKRINLLNIDTKKMKIPNTLNNESIDANKIFTNKNYENYQLLIGVNDGAQKTIGIFINENSKENTKINYSTIIELLEEIINNTKSILNYESEYDYKTYISKINNDKMKELANYIKNSESIENEISTFLKYRPNPTDEELKIYQLYSEFMLLFPSFKNFPRNADNPYCQKYISQYFYSKKAIENFESKIPEIVSKKDRIYLIYTACSCLRYLLNNGFGNKISDLFYFLDFTKEGTIYYDAIDINKKFIGFLTENSEMFTYFIQIYSGSSLDILTNKLSSRMSMLNISQVQSHLSKSIPKYGIRIECFSNFKAVTILETRITCICEIILFNSFLKDITNEIDFDFDKRFRLSTLFKHENFSYQNALGRKVIEPISPIRYYKMYKKEEIAAKNDKKKDESGFDFEYFLCRGDKKLMKILRIDCINSEELFNRPELMAGKSLDEFINILKKTYSVLNKSLEEIDNKVEYRLDRDCDGIPFGFPRREKY